MTATYSREETTVPLPGGRSVTIEPGQPWPSAHRGSRYSLVTSDEFPEGAIKWEQRDLNIHARPPEGLRDVLRGLGKKGGHGIVRITAGGEVLTKIKADDYVNVDQAVVSSGWIPVYVGKLIGELDFGEVNLNPPKQTGSVRIWSGLPFHHGERWSLAEDNELHWRWKDYDFTSAFDHDELVERYRTYRPTGGRLYITELGHVWGNVSPGDLSGERARDIQNAVDTWVTETERQGNTAARRLVNRRLLVTSQTDDPSDGLLPVHLGHVSEFDGGTTPRPVVDDETYFKVVGQYEQVWES
ncbi:MULTISPECIES: hypothetical protein [unclassified Haloferax]|uniref:hypothetical protein n=1 Tax=unclassified Haloferax TaxID=2625095 RepID=UPI002876B644|nr:MULTISPECIES: hypothetical protein [unclassified Haloferax]MDS0243565.1 hypothetical protein [Haloferax sp. S2CR25]MDS0446686.1 hypothetical protein [Haloferax sp. S2CR25-2]